jgi:hypothetical protein
MLRCRNVPEAAAFVDSDGTAAGASSTSAIGSDFGCICTGSASADAIFSSAAAAVAGNWATLRRPPYVRGGAGSTAALFICVKAQETRTQEIVTIRGSRESVGVLYVVFERIVGCNKKGKSERYVTPDGARCASCCIACSLSLALSAAGPAARAGAAATSCVPAGQIALNAAVQT